MRAPFLKTLALLLLVTALIPSAAAEEASDDDLVAWLIKQSKDPEAPPPELALSFGLRLRQENLQNAFHFDSNSDDRNWLRVRSRAGIEYSHGSHRFQLRLVNEFRDTYEPDESWIPLDEIILDQLAWTWGTQPRDPFTMTIGRQKIIWDDGFLMLEGHPLDGSRSIYHNALRLKIHERNGEWELLGIIGPQTDPIVLAGDQERLLSENDEYATALRYSSHAGTAVSLIWKKEHELEDPNWEWCNFTLDLRQQWRGLMGEFALQRHSTADWAYALQASAGADLLPATRGELGIFHYSGDSEDGAAFKTPYGRWPKWSELYIYTLIGEEGVAAWQNIGGLHGHLRQHLGRGVDLHLGAYWLGAPEPEWTARGLLFQSELKFAINDRLSGHLLWEYLEPGAFHENIDEGVHFLRWEINAELN